GIMTAAPYRAIAAAHWAFAGTGLRAGDLFGRASLHERCPGGASGHETDKMSASSPAGTVLLAKGVNPDDGGADMVYHEADGGGPAGVVRRARRVAQAGARRVRAAAGRLVGGGGDALAGGEAGGARRRGRAAAGGGPTARGRGGDDPADLRRPRLPGGLAALR